MKLSAPYEVSKTGAPKYEDVGRLAKALVKHAPGAHAVGEQLAASVGTEGRAPDDADLLDLLLEWAPDDVTRRKILVDNPGAFYGYAPA